VSEDVRYIVVQPALEPNPSFMHGFGGWAIFAYVRWSSWGIGVELMKAGLAVNVGPLLFGFCRVRAQIEAYDRDRERLIGDRP